MTRRHDPRHEPGMPAYDNPTGNKGGNVLYEEEKGHPHGGQHVGKTSIEGQHGQRPGSPKRHRRPIGHRSDRKLGQKPPDD